MQQESTPTGGGQSQQRARALSKAVPNRRWVQGQAAGTPPQLSPQRPQQSSAIVAESESSDDSDGEIPSLLRKSAFSTSTPSPMAAGEGLRRRLPGRNRGRQQTLRVPEPEQAADRTPAKAKKHKNTKKTKGSDDENSGSASPRALSPVQRLKADEQRQELRRAEERSAAAAAARKPRGRKLHSPRKPAAGGGRGAAHLSDGADALRSA